MSSWSRITNVFRRDKVRAEFDEELQSHIDEAIENGRDPEEARRAFGSLLRTRENCQDAKFATWLEALRNDVHYGFRQLLKHKSASAAAILSLALAAGACTSAFRLIDAFLLRPLPVANPERLHVLQVEFRDREGKPDQSDSFEYPMFRELRSAVKGQAELLSISYASRADLTYGTDQEMEKAYRQMVSGWTFGAFGLKPALGRLLTESDDLKPDSHPYAVLSYDYWTRRFNRDPHVLGRTLRLGEMNLEIVGVCEKGFTGTEPGTITDIFVPTMMNGKAINNPNWGWFRTWVKLNPDTPADQVREKLQATFTNYRRERSKDWSGGDASKKEVEEYVNARLLLEPSSAGASRMQRDLRRPLSVLSALVALVLLIACANVANLMTAQATSRAREMALRVSIGAGRLRLLQLVLVESGMIAVTATFLGAIFAAWAAPFVIQIMSPPDDPARLVMPTDWRVIGFSAALTILTALLFGLSPALRASATKPMAVLRGGEHPRSRHRIMQSLTALQMAFCIMVLFLTGLFLATLQKLSLQPTGFVSKDLVVLETVSRTPQSYEFWDQTADHLRSVAGVQSVSYSSWPLMTGNAWTTGIFLNGQLQSEGTPPYVLGVSPNWLDTMKVEWLGGRDFRNEDIYPKTAIVNEEFAKRYFQGANPIGRTFGVTHHKKQQNVTIVGWVKNTRYRDMRENLRPVIFVPFRSLNEQGQADKNNWASIILRVDPGMNLSSIAPRLRQEVPQARPEFRVSDVHTQEEFVQSHLLRERLLAILSSFFAVVALVLAGVGLFGVLQYAMLQRRREIGIRMALGASAGDVARSVTTQSLVTLLIGGGTGLAAGLASSSLLETLLFEVRVTDPTILAIPALILLVTAVLAAIPPVVQAIRIDPASMLRTE